MKLTPEEQEAQNLANKPKAKKQSANSNPDPLQSGNAALAVENQLVLGRQAGFMIGSKAFELGQLRGLQEAEAKAKAIVAGEVDLSFLLTVEFDQEPLELPTFNQLFLPPQNCKALEGAK